MRPPNERAVDPRDRVAGYEQRATVLIDRQPGPNSETAAGLGRHRAVGELDGAQPQVGHPQDAAVERELCGVGEVAAGAVEKAGRAAGHLDRWTPSHVDSRDRQLATVRNI